jgi:hypothetical protein
MYFSSIKMPHPNISEKVDRRLDFKVFRNVINGNLVASKDTRSGVNPSTEKLNEPVPIATKEDVASAVEAARTAFPSWAASGIENRRQALRTWATAFLELKTEFATLLTLEQGKPVSIPHLLSPKLYVSRKASDDRAIDHFCGRRSGRSLLARSGHCKDES